MCLETTHLWWEIKSWARLLKINLTINAKISVFFYQEFCVKKFAKNLHKCLMIKITIMIFFRFLKLIIHLKKAKNEN